MVRKCLTNKNIKIQYSLKSSLYTILYLKTTIGIDIINLKGAFILCWLLGICLVDPQILFLIMRTEQL